MAHNSRGGGHNRRKHGGHSRRGHGHGGFHIPWTLIIIIIIMILIKNGGM